MNQIFSLHRFGLLLKLHLSEHLRTYLMGISLLFGIWIVLMAPTAIKTTHFHESLYRAHGVFFGAVFCGAGAWFASEAFRVVSTPTRGIPYLTLPASQLEKFLVAGLMIAAFMLIATAVFYTVEGTFFSFINSRLPQGEPSYKLLDLSNPAVPPEFSLAILLGLPFFFLGSIYFDKVPFVKTGVIAFLILFVSVFLNEILVGQLFPKRNYYGSSLFREVHFVQNNTWYEIELTDLPKLAVNGILLLIALGLWYTAYIRFKEKEI
ncbi:hypothetical protein WBJ53_26650 [Spirosoma sp. SC4-14]|uniref:hypothetical protein n=1 Tax=Spirosoma sp. SC4-14 TaxID=3128900 RepID=UPI0030D4A451